MHYITNLTADTSYHSHSHQHFLQNLRTRLTGGSALTLSVLPASVVASAVSEALTENYLKFQKEFDRHAYSDVRPTI